MTIKSTGPPILVRAHWEQRSWSLDRGIIRAARAVCGTCHGVSDQFIQINCLCVTSSAVYCTPLKRCSDASNANRRNNLGGNEKVEAVVKNHARAFTFVHLCMPLQLDSRIKSLRQSDALMSLTTESCRRLLDTCNKPHKSSEKSRLAQNTIKASEKIVQGV